MDRLTGHKFVSGFIRGASDRGYDWHVSKSTTDGLRLTVTWLGHTETVVNPGLVWPADVEEGVGYGVAMRACDALWATMVEKEKYDRHLAASMAEVGSEVAQMVKDGVG